MCLTLNRIVLSKYCQIRHFGCVLAMRCAVLCCAVRAWINFHTLLYTYYWPMLVWPILIFCFVYDCFVNCYSSRNIGLRIGISEFRTKKNFKTRTFGCCGCSIHQLSSVFGWAASSMLFGIFLKLFIACRHAQCSRICFPLKYAHHTHTSAHGYTSCGCWTLGATNENAHFKADRSTSMIAGAIIATADGHTN